MPVGTSIIKCNIEELIVRLNAALASEYQAWSQYIISAALTRGVLAKESACAFLSHADEELEHAGILVRRIIELDGRPVTEPSTWSKLHEEQVFGNDTSVNTMVRLNTTGEGGAIKMYSDLFEFTDGKDVVTASLIEEILGDEVRHERELLIILENLEQ